MDVGFVILGCVIAISLAAVIICFLERIITASTKIRKAVFVLTENEASNNFVFTDRLPDVGGWIDIQSLTDQEFFDRVSVTLCGIACVNNKKSVKHSNSADFEFDVARRTDMPWELLFSQDGCDVATVHAGDVVQITLHG